MLGSGEAHDGHGRVGGAHRRRWGYGHVATTRASSKSSPGKGGEGARAHSEDEVLLGLSRGGVTTANRGGEWWRPEDEEGPAPLAAVAPSSHGGAWTT